VVTGTQFSWYKQSLGPTMSPGHWISEAPSPGVRFREREFSRSHLCNTKIMNAWSQSSPPSYACVARWLHGRFAFPLDEEL
jgi:hypothetical protein